MKNIDNKELNSELESRFLQNKKTLNEIHDLTLELSKVNKKLEESEALKSHFISNIRNEIINPFASILGLSSNIISMKNPDWAKVQSMVTLIHSEAFNLDFQLRNIFAAAEIEAGESTPQITKSVIENVILLVIEHFHHIAEQKKIKINFNSNNKKNKEEPDYFNTDTKKVEIIFGNILSNALRFSSPNTTVTIDIHQQSRQIAIIVKDQGIGIEENHRIAIFDRFKRINNSIHTLNTGYGLGLSVARDYTELLNGRITYESKLGVGTEFKIEISESQISTEEEEGDDFILNDTELF